MNPSGYILELMKVEKLNVKPGIVADELLKFFVKYPKCSTYQTHKYLKQIYKKDNRTISYKNVHKRIQKLYQLGLIREIKNKDKIMSKHGAIYYSLTTCGIFYILKNHLIVDYRNLIIEHRYDGLYENFLYPYIQFNTINKINDIQFMIRICIYLSKCCGEILETVEPLKQIEHDGGRYYPVTNTRYLLNPDDKKPLIEFIQYLKERFGLNWLNEKGLKLEVIENDLNIVINSEGKKLFLKLYPDEKKAVLSLEDEIIFEFLIRREDYDLVGYDIVEFFPSDFHEYVEYNSDFSHLLPISYKYKLCYDVIEYIKNLEVYTHLSKDEKEKNKKILRLDKNFLNLLREFKKNFDSYYNNFVEIK